MMVERQAKGVVCCCCCVCWRLWGKGGGNGEKWGGVPIYSGGGGGNMMPPRPLNRLGDHSPTLSAQQRQPAVYYQPNACEFLLQDRTFRETFKKKCYKDVKTLRNWIRIFSVWDFLAKNVVVHCKTPFSPSAHVTAIHNVRLGTWQSGIILRVHDDDRTLWTNDTIRPRENCNWMWRGEEEVGGGVAGGMMKLCNIAGLAVATGGKGSYLHQKRHERSF